MANIELIQTTTFVLHFIGSAGVYAFLYYATPKKNVWFKMLFLIGAILSIVLSANQVHLETLDYFNATEISAENWLANTRTSYTANVWILIISMILIVILFLFWLFENFGKKKTTSHEV